VPDGAWDNPTQCEGWVARDVVRHLAEWLPAFFFARWGIDPLDGVDVDRDPVGAWTALDARVRAAFADRAVASAVKDTQVGSMSFDAAFDMIATNDVLMHTWDLAQATGQDTTLDPREVDNLLGGLLSMDEQMLRDSGQYGPRVDVPADASPQDQLMAFIGRNPLPSG
jgi:uncharacterized protein (TIGR03086 family)